mmetsp:Transcript_13787/g.34434  ORF Transcript_13787/g.34434 Transcript_13787/m.34434 type:complete len:90 (-) Transcript_13787:20-289(-)
MATWRFAEGNSIREAESSSCEVVKDAYTALMIENARGVSDFSLGKGFARVAPDFESREATVASGIGFRRPAGERRKSGTCCMDECTPNC